MMLQLISVPRGGVRILKFGPSIIQTATITSRSTRGGPATLPKPFPYESKRFNIFHSFFDPTIVKMSQENAKIIAVEGPIAVGKSAFCKTLAEEFDMLYIPEPTLDAYYVLPSGYDLRKHDDELPEEIRSYDHKNFCVDPKNVKAALFQLRMLYLRFYKYVDAMCHLMNTGQGVVLERSFFSDYVFMKAMYENKYISKKVHDAYLEILHNVTVFPSPHLIIYLDIGVPVVQERIRTRNFSYEQNSPALTKEYLKSLENYWKHDYLKSAKKRSEVLVYDWTDGGDVDVVIDDIEKIDFDIMRHDNKFVDWWFTRSRLYKLRKEYTNNPYELDRYFVYPFFLVDELFTEPHHLQAQEKILLTIPDCQFDVGYNYKTGDSILNILFKTNIEKHRAFKHHLLTGYYID